MGWAFVSGLAMNGSLLTSRPILRQLNLIVVLAIGIALLVAGSAMMLFDALDARDAMIGEDGNTE